MKTMQNRNGFSLVELMTAVTILSVVAVAITHFASDSQKITRNIEGRLEANTESVRFIETLKRQFHERNGSMTVTADGSSVTMVSTLPVGSPGRPPDVIYSSTCEIVRPQHSKRNRPIMRIVTDSTNNSRVLTCPADCPQGERPVVRISVGTRQSQYPLDSQGLLFGAKMCAEAISGSTGKFQVFIFTAYDTGMRGGKLADGTFTDFLWDAHGSFLTAGMGSVTIK